MTRVIREPQERVRSQIGFTGLGRTDQSMADACDINKIMSKYERTGEIPHQSNVVGSYGDFSDIPDLLTARLQIEQADKAFMALPAYIRKRMDNSPQVLLDFIADPSNDEEARELGILPPLERPANSQNPKEPETPPEPPTPVGETPPTQTV